MENLVFTIFDNEIRVYYTLWNVEEGRETRQYDESFCEFYKYSNIASTINETTYNRKNADISFKNQNDLVPNVPNV